MLRCLPTLSGFLSQKLEAIGERVNATLRVDKPGSSQEILIHLGHRFPRSWGVAIGLEDVSTLVQEASSVLAGGETSVKLLA